MTTPTAKLPKTRPAKFVSDLPASNARMMAIGRHNAAEFERLFGLEVEPYKITQSNGETIVVIPEFVWDRWFTRPLKNRVRWTIAFHYHAGSTEDATPWAVDASQYATVKK